MRRLLWGVVKQRWPTLVTKRVDQMTSAWLNKPNDPGMSELRVLAEEVYGLVILIQL